MLLVQQLRLVLLHLQPHHRHWLHQAHHQPHQALAALAVCLPLFQLLALPRLQILVMSLPVFPLLFRASLAPLLGLWPQLQECYKLHLVFPLAKKFVLFVSDFDKVIAPQKLAVL